MTAVGAESAFLRKSSAPKAPVKPQINKRGSAPAQALTALTAPFLDLLFLVQKKRRQTLADRWRIAVGAYSRRQNADKTPLTALSALNNNFLFILFFTYFMFYFIIIKFYFYYFYVLTEPAPLSAPTAFKWNIFSAPAAFQWYNYILSAPSAPSALTAFKWYILSLCLLQALALISFLPAP